MLLLIKTRFYPKYLQSSEVTMSVVGWIPERVKGNNWLCLRECQGTHIATRVLKMCYTSSSGEKTLYGVKTIKCASDDTEELLVDMDYTTINWRRNHMDMPNLIKVYSMWEEKQISIATRLCVLMDWTGTSLQTLIESGTRYDGLPWYEIMRGIANGVNQVHTNRIVHGDLKPSNILTKIDNNTNAFVTPDQVFISDIGVRHWWGKYNSKTEEMMRMIGTVQYSTPPEALEDGTLTPATDIWAIGCIGWELFTGSRLFENDAMIESYKNGVLSIDPILISRVQENQGIYEILSKCLKVNVADRWDIWTLQANLGPFGAPV